MATNSLMFTDSVICYKELIDKEETTKRQWRGKYGNSDVGWRPVEPFEKTGASECSARRARFPPRVLNIMRRCSRDCRCS